MKKIGQLMKDIGFKANSSDSVKEAFLKYLINQSEGVMVQTPSEKKIIEKNPDKILKFPVQLVFDFDESERPQKVK